VAHATPHACRRARDWGRAVAVLAALTLMLALVVPAVVSSDARAVTGPATSATWVYNTPDQMQPIIAGSSGTVLYEYSPLTEGLSATGSPQWSITRLPGFGLYRPVTDAAGNSYDIEQQDIGQPVGTYGRFDVVARQGGTTLWHVTPDSGYVLRSIAIGNGRVYIAGNPPDTLTPVLFVLNASTGATLAQVPINDESVDQLDAFNGGVVAMTVNGGTGTSTANYFGADGSPGPTYTLPTGYAANSSLGEPTVQTDGTAYLTAYTTGGSCTVPTVVIVSRAAGVADPVNINGSCTYGSLNAVVTPQGLAVENGDGLVTLVHPDGTQSTPHAMPTTPGTFASIIAMHANTDGNLVVAQTFLVSCTPSAGTPSCPGLQVDLVDPATGNLVAPAAQMVPQTPGAYYDLYQPQGIAFDGNRLYASLVTPGATSQGTAGLWAFDTNALGLEYPEAVLSGTGGPTPAPSPTPTPTTTPPPVYVVLGDSYSSGEGNPPYDLGTNTGTDKCHRSPKAWPRMLATQDSPVGTLSQFACSGAITSDITSTSRSGESPQITALKGLRHVPSLVTITIGGNDIGFANILKDCVTSLAVGGCAGDGTLQRASNKISKLVPTLVKTLQAVESAAPGADVVLVGYPSLFPTKFTNTTSLHCAWLGPRENKGLVALAAQLNSAEQSAANQTGVGYVPTLTVLSGHELCTGKSWVAALTAANAGSQAAGHPLGQGQQAMEAAVDSYLNRIA
jgi:lysophospholipase L1-like esterase